MDGLKCLTAWTARFLLSFGLRSDMEKLLMRNIELAQGRNYPRIDGKKEEIISDVSPSDDLPIQNGWKWFTLAHGGNSTFF